MSFEAQDRTITIDGVNVPLLPSAADPLGRAVIISLFSWRRANADDRMPDPSGGLGARMGWWGDGHARVAGDRIGSRLWLLSRATITLQTISQARDYARESLEWLVQDKIAARVEVDAARRGLDGVALTVRIYRADGSVRVLEFSDVWSMIRG